MGISEGTGEARGEGSNGQGRAVRTARRPVQIQG